MQYILINVYNSNIETEQVKIFGSFKSWLGYIFVSSRLQEFVNSSDILPALSINHSPLLISLSNDKPDKNGNSFWKFINSLVGDIV